MTIVRPEDWQPQGVDYLEPRAWEALRLTDQSVLVTAGAGAGKTEFLAQKATYLLQTNLCPNPKRILAISFKRDAARNLKARIDKRCPPEQARRFNSFTFDAFAKSLVDRFRSAIPDPFSPPIDYQIVMPTRRDYENFLDRKNVQSINSQQLELEIASTRLPIMGNNDISNLVGEYWHEQYDSYEEVYLSFAMINRLVEWLLRENPLIQCALRLTYPIIFLDEFQDTTSAQFELLSTAFGVSDPVYTAVGDDKQCIMGWAGAMPDAFERFQETFSAENTSLLSNWRSHEDLVKIQHVIASRIDPNVEIPNARATRSVDGDVAAIWDFDSNEQEAEGLANWINREVRSSDLEPHDIAILVRMYANNVEEQLAQAFSRAGLRLRNETRKVGDIQIQDLLSEDLTEIFLPILRLGATERSPEDWIDALQFLQYLGAIDPYDDLGQQQSQKKLERLVRDLRLLMDKCNPEVKAAGHVVQTIMEFITESSLRQAIPEYQRQKDFDRVWNGFTKLFGECADRTKTWSQTLDEFIGLGQVPLMTIHKSKGLEFHTMVFYGLDNQTWWSLKPSRPEELNTFFVAFSRAEQRAFFTLCRERGEPVNWIERLLEPAGVRRVESQTLIAGSN